MNGKIKASPRRKIVRGVLVTGVVIGALLLVTQRILAWRSGTEMDAKFYAKVIPLVMEGEETEADRAFDELSQGTRRGLSAAEDSRKRVVAKRIVPDALRGEAAAQLALGHI
ncbi:MAG: hypothetical protein WCS01_13245, partial [bacterium]